MSNTSNSTKLILCVNDVDVVDELKLKEAICQWFTDLDTTSNWGINLPMPVSIDVSEEVRVENKRSFWHGKKKVEVPVFAYYLIFDRALTPDELNLWRLFKLGFFVGKNAYKYQV